eukprot:1575735-Rhodomonas_salina.2
MSRRSPAARGSAKDVQDSWRAGGAGWEERLAGIMSTRGADGSVGSAADARWQVDSASSRARFRSSLRVTHLTECRKVPLVTKTSTGSQFLCIRQ